MKDAAPHRQATAETHDRLRRGMTEREGRHHPVEFASSRRPEPAASVRRVGGAPARREGRRRREGDGLIDARA